MSQIHFHLSGSEAKVLVGKDGALILHTNLSPNLHAATFGSIKLAYYDNSEKEMKCLDVDRQHSGG